MGMSSASATISSSLPLPIRFGLGYRLPKCSTTGTSKFPCSGFAARLRCFKPNRACVPIRITMAGRGMTTVVFASGADPQSEGDLSTSKGEITRDSSADGLPIWTILAGLVVFLLLLWFVGSLVLWILRLFVK
ncbi:uncharacterized protein LOC116261176 [Nymphaea colorata]|nr:uncharacterized protein LOC116261176 [Nymphaea colorata]